MDHHSLQFKNGTISVIKGGCGFGGRASGLLSEGLWFDSPGLHVKVSLNPKLLLMCWLAPPPSVYECMYELL